MTGPTATTATMRIGDIARAADTSVPVVRKYDQAGLLPATSRSDGGFRLYTEADVQRLHLLRQMRLFGFAAADMRDLLDLLDASGATAQLSDQGCGSCASSELSNGATIELNGFLERARTRERQLRAQLRSAHELITTIQDALAAERIPASCSQGHGGAAVSATTASATTASATTASATTASATAASATTASAAASSATRQKRRSRPARS